VTIRTMVRATALILVALVLAACADEGSDAGDDGTAGRDARRALQAAERLETRVADLESDVEETLRRGDLKELKENLGSLRQKLRGALADLRAALGDVKGRIGSASSAADSAMARAEKIARDLAVLQDRFNFHLKRDHGGG
jgi:chromosome segregation ATPase